MSNFYLTQQKEVLDFGNNLWHTAHTKLNKRRRLPMIINSLNLNDNKYSPFD